VVVTLVSGQNTPTSSMMSASPAQSKLIAPAPPILTPPNGLDANCRWSYDGVGGPYFWSTLCTGSCGGDAQSPIDLIPHYTTKNQRLGNIYSNYSDAQTQVQFDGRNLIFTPMRPQGFGSLSKLPSMDYLHTPSAYTFTQAKLHATSEHTVYGMPFNAELHMIHTSKVNYTDSTIIICIMFQVGSVGTNGSNLLGGTFRAIRPFVTNSSVARQFTTVFNVSWNSSLPLLRPNSGFAQNGSYYHYIGSRSSPPCAQNVSHFVFKEPMYISQEEYSTFYTLLHDLGRPLQRQNKRTVYYFNAHEPTSAAGSLKVPFWARWFF